MNAILLCAGFGTRLSPLTDSLPKPLIRIAGFTLIHDTLLHLLQQGVDTAVVNGSWMADMIEDYLSNADLPLQIIFQREEEPLGTAGAVRKALPYLGEEFLVVYGDNLTRQPVAPLIELHRRLDSEITIALAPTGEPSSKGIVLTEPDGRISYFREKPPDEVAESNLANSGLYICRKSAVEHLNEGEFSDFGKNVFPMLLNEGRVLAADTPGGYTRDIGTGKSYLIACHDVLSGRLTPYTGNGNIKNGILIENTQSYDDIELKSTFWAEKGARISKGCSLENCVVLSGAVIGADCALKNSLVMPGTEVPECTIADDKYLKVF
ncbi:MAG: NTP transferase domain-containing protein [Candidatus Aegiribacteria sp.]|nr:NTP transferase domain-containing protein [Candidatus Aegiribacteria sp.]